jgi:hypothetical protein
MTVARELARYKLDLVGVHEVRWDKGGTVRAGDYNFSMVAGCCECGNEPLGSVKCGEILD